MPSLILSQNDRPMSIAAHGPDGMSFANAAVEFAALGWEAEQCGIVSAQLHLYALSIELAFKSLALRVGATLAECKKSGHRVSEIIRLIESRGIKIPAALKRRLNNDKWFQKMLGTRYPVLIANPTIENTVFFHKDYPEMIAGILEIPCSSPLGFEGNSALHEIKTLLSSKRAKGKSPFRGDDRHK
jgi:hypothetical protein